MNSADIDRLRQFLGAYFHQDWSADATDADGIIDRYLSDHSNKDEVAQMAALIDAYAQRVSDDRQLERALVTELWCEFVPSTAGVRARDWLQHVAARLRAAAGG